MGSAVHDLCVWLRNKKQTATRQKRQFAKLWQWFYSFLFSHSLIDNSAWGHSINIRCRPWAAAGLWGRCCDHALCQQLIAATHWLRQEYRLRLQNCRVPSSSSPVAELSLWHSPKSPRTITCIPATEPSPRRPAGLSLRTLKVQPPSSCGGMQARISFSSQTSTQHFKNVSISVLEVVCTCILRNSNLVLSLKHCQLDVVKSSIYHFTTQFLCPETCWVHLGPKPWLAPRTQHPSIPPSLSRMCQACQARWARSYKSSGSFNNPLPNERSSSFHQRC